MDFESCTIRIDYVLRKKQHTPNSSEFDSHHCPIQRSNPSIKWQKDVMLIIAYSGDGWLRTRAYSFRTTNSKKMSFRRLGSVRIKA